MAGGGNARPTDVRWHGSADLGWQMVECPPHPALAGLVRYCTVYSEAFTDPLRRRQIPSPGLPLIVSHGDPLRIATASGTHTVHGFVAGLHDGPAMTGHAGRQSGVGVHLTPLGAYRLLGMPVSRLTNAIVELSDLWGRAGTGLLERLADDGRGWEHKRAVLDTLLLARLRDAPSPSPEVVWTWHRLCATAGRARIADIAAETGWSHRHLVSRCREQLGLAPKAAARLLRFDCAARMVADPRRSLADIAASTGYSDQAHFAREFHALAGCPPAAYRATHG